MQGPGLAIHQPDSVLNSMNAWCTDTHNKSGLTNRCRESNVSLEEAETKASTLKTQLPLQDSSTAITDPTDILLCKRSCSFHIQPSSHVHEHVNPAKISSVQVPLFGYFTIKAQRDSTHCSTAAKCFMTFKLCRKVLSLLLHKSCGLTCLNGILPAHSPCIYIRLCSAFFLARALLYTGHGVLEKHLE